jgi:hypothetical protein
MKYMLNKLQRKKGTLKTATYEHELGVSTKSSTHIGQIAAYKGGGLICMYTKKLPQYPRRDAHTEISTEETQKETGNTR